MPDSRPEELIQAEQLIYEAKFAEAFEVIENFEEKGTSTQKDALLFPHTKFPCTFFA